MASFDIVSKVDEQELSNAVIQARKEIATRFDFKGSKSDIILEKTELKLVTEDDMKLRSMTDILNGKLIKRGISTKNMRYGKIEEVGGKMKQQKIAVKQGVEREEAKQLIQIIKVFDNLQVKENFVKGKIWRVRILCLPMLFLY